LQVEGQLAEGHFLGRLNVETDPLVMVWEGKVFEGGALNPLRRSQWVFLNPLLTSYLTSWLVEKQELIFAECESATEIWVTLHESYTRK
jgi:hypothetical protein